MSTVKLEPARVHDLVLWEEGMKGGEQRFTRRHVAFKNADADSAIVQATGTLNTTSPVAVIVLTAQAAGLYAGAAGNLGAITLAVVNGASEGVAYASGVLTVTVDITGGHNTITAMNTVLTASANWVSTVSSGGAGTITVGTVGTVTLAGGKDVVAVQTSLPIGAPLQFDTDHYKPVGYGHESSTAAILLANLDDLVDDEVVADIPVLFAGPAIVNMDALQLLPYVVRATVMTALEAKTPYSIDRVNEPVKQTNG